MKAYLSDWLNRLGLRNKILIILLLISLCPLTITTIIATNRSRELLISFGQTQLDLASAEVARQVYTLLTTLEKHANVNANDGTLRDYISEEGFGTNLDNLRRRYLYTQELYLLTPSGVIVDISLAPGIESRYAPGANLSKASEIKAAFSTRNTALVFISPDTLTFASYLYKNDDTHGGFLIEIISSEPLRSIIDDATNELGFPLLKRSNGEIVLGHSYDDSYIVSRTPISLRGFSAEFVQHRSAFLQPVNALNLTSLILGTVSFAIVTIISFFASNYFVSPINSLLEAIRKFNETQRLGTISTRRKDEFGRLLSEFGSLAERVVSADELSSRNQMLEATFYSLHHDLRGGVDDVTFALDLVKESISQEQLVELNLTDVVTLLEQGTLRTLTILEGLKQWITAGKGIEQREIVSIVEIVEDLKKSKYYPGVIVCERVPKLLGNRGMLFIVFENLISNGLKYNESTQPEVRIYSEAGRIIIEDNGIGMKPEQLSRIFQPFQRGNYDKEGSGLGLAITKAIITAHNFKINVESDEGKGTRFVISYPKIYEVT